MKGMHEFRGQRIWQDLTRLTGVALTISLTGCQLLNAPEERSPEQERADMQRRNEASQAISKAQSDAEQDLAEASMQKRKEEQAASQRAADEQRERAGRELEQECGASRADR